MTLLDELKFEFEKVICTDLLLPDHKNSLISRNWCSRNLDLFDKELMAKLTGLKKTVRAIHCVQVNEVPL